MATKKKKDSHVHEDLKGLNISINEFGEIVMNKSNEELNSFLNENVDDKKLKEREKTLKKKSKK